MEPQRVTVTVLGLGAGPPMDGVVGEFLGRGMRLIVPRRIAPESAIRIDLEDSDALVLGEVTYCEALEGGYAIGVELHHSLVNLASIAALVNRLLGEESRTREEDSRPVPNALS